MNRASAIVAGVGAEHGPGTALCRRFAAEGLHVFVAGRTEQRIEKVAATIRASGGSAEPVPTDLTRAEEVSRLFERARSTGGGIGPAELVVFNAGNNWRFGSDLVSPETFEEYWRVGYFAGFLVGREAVEHLAQQEAGSLIFTGATASIRGGAGFSHFAAAKAGLRAVAQSLARQFGPLGIHVAHVIIDGGIDGEHLRTVAPQLLRERGEEGLLDVAAIAETYWQLHRQPRSAWTHELDLRPFKEKF